MAAWTVEQTMQNLGTSRASLYNLIKRGRLTKHQHALGQGMGGRRTYFDAAEVKALKNAIKVAESQDASVSIAQIKQVLTTQLAAVRRGEQRGLLSAPTAYALRQTLWAIGNALRVKIVTGDELKPKP